MSSPEGADARILICDLLLLKEKEEKSVRRLNLCLVVFVILLFLASCLSLFDKPPDELTFDAIATGNWFTLALGSNGSVWAWGLNEQGQLGDGTNDSSSTPIPITKPE